MENREILIADTKTQKKYKFMTTATTLGELQDAMTAHGIDFSGMEFTEGITKTKLIGRDSLLPQNVMYRGVPTNNLVFLLTNTSKNIASGAETRGRKEAYEVIKGLGRDIMETIKAEYGRNYTQVPTAALWAFIDGNTNTSDEPLVDIPVEPEEADDEPLPEATPAQRMVISVYDHIKLLANINILSPSDLEAIAEMTQELAARMKETGSRINISDAELDSMIASL